MTGSVRSAAAMRHHRVGIRSRRWTAAVLAALAVLAAPAQADPAAEFDTAMAAYERNHWTQAFAAFARLGDAGHAQAARVALQMWRHGPALYGREFDATPAQRQQWARLNAVPDSVAPSLALRPHPR